MKVLYLLIIMICNSIGSFAQDPGQDLKEIIQQQETDWNKNDMKAFSSVFSDDATLINFLGMYWKGRENIITEFSHINECCIKPTMVKFEFLDSKMLSKNAAFAHIKETLTAKEDYAVPGGMVKKGTVSTKFITAIFEKSNKNKWEITSMQVTQVTQVNVPPGK